MSMAGKNELMKSVRTAQLHRSLRLPWRPVLPLPTLLASKHMPNAAVVSTGQSQKRTNIGLHIAVTHMHTDASKEEEVKVFHKGRTIQMLILTIS